MKILQAWKVHFAKADDIGFEITDSSSWLMVENEDKEFTVFFETFEECEKFVTKAAEAIAKAKAERVEEESND